MEQFRRAIRTDRPSRGRPAFTMTEMLVTMSIVALMVVLLLPSLSAVQGRSRKFACQMNLRSVAFDFRMFADPQLHGFRGDDEDDPNLPGRNDFWLETFQESQYQVDEFWKRPGSFVQMETDDLGVMSCPEVSGQITLRDDTPCRAGAVQPANNISFAFNLRLDFAERKIRDAWTVQQTPVTGRILTHARPIPLVWDIDGQVAAERRITPHYSAPPMEPGAPYGDGKVWFPAFRHAGKMQIALVTGEVVCTDDPLNEANWDWAYTP